MGELDREDDRLFQGILSTFQTRHVGPFNIRPLSKDRAYEIDVSVISIIQATDYAPDSPARSFFRSVSSSSALPLLA